MIEFYGVLSEQCISTTSKLIITNNMVQKAINVFYYSKKQVVKIIDETIGRAKQLGNELQFKTGQEILAEFLELQKKK